jgi:hypothetical protein
LPTARTQRPVRAVTASLLGAATSTGLLLGLPAVASAQATPLTQVSQAQAEAQFGAAGVTWSSTGNCTDRNNSACTSFDGLKDGTVAGVISLKRMTRCPISITGGTEAGHRDGPRSHHNGYKVDIRHNPCIDGYIKGELPRIADRADGYPQWQSLVGDIYCDEGDHFDVVYP